MSPSSLLLILLCLLFFSCLNSKKTSNPTPTSTSTSTSTRTTTTTTTTISTTQITTRTTTTTSPTITTTSTTQNTTRTTTSPTTSTTTTSTTQIPNLTTTTTSPTTTTIQISNQTTTTTSPTTTTTSTTQIPTLTTTTTSTTTPTPTPTPTQILSGVYFGNWKVYGRGYKLCSLPYDKIDRIYYGFLDPTSGECKLSDAFADTEQPGPENVGCGGAQQFGNESLRGNFYQLQKIREKNPNITIFASLGGWTYSPMFHNYMKSPTDRARMVQSCVNLINQYSMVFNGLDIDLEYPCLPDDASCGLSIIPTDNDREYFAAWMEEFRAALPSNFLLTIATSAGSSKIRALDFTRLNKVLDGYNIMTYDFTSGSWGFNTTGHNSNPYANPADPLLKDRESGETVVINYLKAGCAPSKINLGVAFYGRGFAIDPAYVGSASPFVPAIGGLTYGTWETNVFDYYEIKSKYMGSSNEYVYWDDVAKSPYIYNKALNQFISYEDPRSIAAKRGLVQKYGLGGLFAWEISSDTDDYELVKAMRGL